VSARRARQVAAPTRSLTRWVLLFLLVSGLATSMAVDRLTHPALPERPPGESVLAGLDHVGPLLDLGGDSMRSAQGRPGALGVALVDTGDTGAWDAVAAVLGAHGARATWFVRGSTVVDHGTAVTRVRDAGHELGVIGFSGRDLAGLPGWRLHVELSTTQAALVAREGVTVPLALMPAAATRDTFDATAFGTARAVGRDGYAVVVGTPPEQAQIGDIAVVPLDAQAPSRLEALLGRVATTGGAGTAVSGYAGLDPAAINRPVGGWGRANALAVVGGMRLAHHVSVAVTALFVPLTVLLGLRAVAGALLAVAHRRRQRRRRRREVPWTGPVTVVVPAYNEAAGIAATVRSLVASRWAPGVWVVVVDDGSTDGTAGIVEDLRLPGVHVIRQPNQGKPAALNAGLAAARTDVVVLIDGDTVVEPTTIAELVAPFSDPRVGAVSGNAKVANRRSVLGRCQHVEYVIGFNLDRRMLDVFGAIPTVPGAAGAFRRRALHGVGGVSDDTLAEDTDLTIALQRAGWRVVYRDRAVAWTEAPSSIGDLWRQRYRWCYGTLQATWKHRRALVEGRAIGLVGLPYALVYQVGLAVLAPVVDAVALVSLLTGGAGPILAAWLAFTAVQVLLGVVAFRLDGERLTPLWVVPLQQVFYRQLMYLVVVQSVASAGAGSRLRWHKLRRLGAGGPAAPAPAARPRIAPWVPPPDRGTPAASRHSAPRGPTSGVR